MTITNFPTYLAEKIVTRKEVVLDLETVISSYAVATKPDFDVKTGPKVYYSITCLS